MFKPKILVVDDDPNMLAICAEALTQDGCDVRTAASANCAFGEIAANLPDIVIADFKMPGMDGISFLDALTGAYSDIPVILMTGYATVELAVKAMKRGACDFLSKPLDMANLMVTVRNALERKSLREENQLLRRDFHLRRGLKNILGACSEMRRVFDYIEKAAISNASVIIYGESGTGKELVARAIHECSPRSEKPFVPVTCAAIPETLLESQLFGHVKGAFTGAISDYPGFLKSAEEGSLFLDEIGELPLPVQVKLLRVLQDHVCTPVGSSRQDKVDFRVISATNRNLKKAVNEGDFRRDLFYRLHVIPVYLPPLRVRTGDIPMLIEHFMEKYSNENNMVAPDIAGEAMDFLVNYRWPGNVRELENLIQRLVVLKGGQRVGSARELELLVGAVTDLSERLDGSESQMVDKGNEAKTVEQMSLSDLECAHIIKTLESTGGNRTAAAKSLGIARRTLFKKIKDYDIDVPCS